ncbi:PP2C family protein-serine/threonine phosphatase [Spiroplasma endosymbiont of Labia minor]|uniref:PP2C family protein-serine/threonine phosphatase n=1 Tax=Spiroplasma endosymbiont of Labia minor TaxID=3066305 RepID=UPI0030CC2358
MHFKYAKLTDIGNFRKANQDYLTFSTNKFGQSFGIVCDGMGGHAHGEIASKIAVDSFVKMFDSYDFNNLNNSEINKWLRKSVNEILEKMIDYASIHKETLDMGTTLTAILFANKKAYVVNIGDSRTYKLVNNNLFQISQDQNLWNSTPEEDRDEIKTNNNIFGKTSDVTFWKVLTSALGPSKTLRIDTYFLEDPYGVFILTSDGVHDYFDEEIVVATLQNQKLKLKDKAQLIISDAKDNMSTDNLSILIIEVSV